MAKVVYHNTIEMPPFEEMSHHDAEGYLTVAKLTAILRLANVLDRSHTQKLTGCTVVRKGNELMISATPTSDVTLEAQLLERKADFFEEIYGIRPVLRQKRGF